MKLSEAKQLFDKGTPLAEIADGAGVSIYDIKFALGIDSDDELMMQLYEEGLHDHEIAERMSCTTSRVFSFRKRKGLVGQKRSPQSKADWHRDKLLKMHQENKTATEMAKATGLTYGTIYYWLKKHGLWEERSNG